MKTKKKKKKKTEAPLFPKSENRGRPLTYDYTNFLHPNVTYVVLLGVGRDQYDTVRSTFARWRKLNGVKGRFRYDFHLASENGPKHLVIWKG